MDPLINHCLNNAQRALELQLMLAASQQQQHVQPSLPAVSPAAFIFNSLPAQEKQLVYQYLLADATRTSDAHQKALQQQALANSLMLTQAQTKNQADQPLDRLMNLPETLQLPTVLLNRDQSPAGDYSRPNVIIQAQNPPPPSRKLEQKLSSSAPPEVKCELLTSQVSSPLADYGDRKLVVSEPLEIDLLSSKEATADGDPDFDSYVDVESLEEEDGMEGVMEHRLSTPSCSSVSPSMAPEDGGKQQSKNQRRAHILFYRKVRVFQRVAKQGALTCRKCGSAVGASEHDIRSHINFHSPTELFRCVLCHGQFKTRQQGDLYQHLISEHQQGFSKVRSVVDMVSYV